MRLAWLSLAFFLAVPQNVLAQNKLAGFVIDTAKDVANDPTTYAPFGASWLGKQLDWNSSQVLFKNGYVEENPDFTVNGLPHDKPLSHGAGSKKLVLVSLPVLELSVINNTAASVVERLLINRYPERRKLIKTLGWVEKITVAGYIGYKFSSPNFKQWQTNKNMARREGFR